jgi:hypothetical protein
MFTSKTWIFQSGSYSLKFYMIVFWVKLWERETHIKWPWIKLCNWKICLLITPLRSIYYRTLVVSHMIFHVIFHCQVFIAEYFIFHKILSINYSLSSICFHILIFHRIFKSLIFNKIFTLLLIYMHVLFGDFVGFNSVGCLSSVGSLLLS